MRNLISPAITLFGLIFADPRRAQIKKIPGQTTQYFEYVTQEKNKNIIFSSHFNVDFRSKSNDYINLINLITFVNVHLTITEFARITTTSKIQTRTCRIT